MTDGGGIFVALTSCRDEERVQEFLTWYEEVQFRNALAMDGLDHSPKTAVNVKGWSYILSNLKTVLETGKSLPPVM